MRSALALASAASCLHSSSLCRSRYLWSLFSACLSGPLLFLQLRYMPTRRLHFSFCVVVLKPRQQTIAALGALEKAAQHHPQFLLGRVEVALGRRYTANTNTLSLPFVASLCMRIEYLANFSSLVIEASLFRFDLLLLNFFFDFTALLTRAARPHWCLCCASS